MCKVVYRNRRMFDHFNVSPGYEEESSSVALTSLIIRVHSLGRDPMEIVMLVLKLLAFPGQFLGIQVVFLYAPHSYILIRHRTKYVLTCAIIPSSNISLSYVEYSFATSSPSFRLEMFMHSPRPDTM